MSRSTSGPRKRRVGGAGHRSHMLALEPRMMFDGAAVASAATTLAPDGGGDQHQADGPAPSGHAPVHAGDAGAFDGSRHDATRPDALPAAAFPVDAYATADRDTAVSAIASERHLERESLWGERPAVSEAPAAAADLIFIDTSVENYQDLADEWSGRGEVVLIDAARDGVEQMMAALAGRSGIGAIHIVSHGAGDRLMLGTTVIDTAAVNGELARSLAAIGSKLTADGDILIYGCAIDTGVDDAGQRFIDAIAAKTGADIAASDDPTGAAARGGDWDLEARSGTVTAYTLVSDRYRGLLQLTNPSSAWTLTGNTAASNTIDGVTVTFTLTDGTGTFTGNIVDTLNPALTTSFANGAAGTQDFRTTFGTGATGNVTGTITLTFSQAVTNPIIHIDRLGGVAAGGLSNSATLTLTNSGATLTKLAGVDHLTVTNTQISRAVGISTAGAESSADGATGTAAGSVRVNGTFTTIMFSISALAADAFELSTTADASPDAQNDAFAINRGQTLTGNLFANNGSGADADIRGDAFSITRVNGATFTAGQAIALSNGSLTITNASTGAFSFVPNGAYPSGPQTFTYTIADANGGTDTATVTIAVNDPPVVALGSTNLVTNGSFENGSGWTAESGAVEYSSSPATYGSPAAPDGTRFVEVEGAGTSHYIEQTIATTAGQQYSFSLQATTRTANNVGDRGSLFVNGTKVLDFTTNAQFQTFMASFTATGASTVIRIQSEGSTSGTAAGATDGSGLIVDDVQVRAINDTVTYTENGAAVAIAGSGNRVLDFDNANLASATVTLTNQQSGDRLLVNGSAAASGTIGTIGYTRTDTGVSFTGSATKAQYEAAIRAVQFETVGDNPTTTARTITVVASDGTATSNTATVTVAVTPVNDAPVNTLPATYTVAEDSVLALSGLQIADVDAGTGTMTITLTVPSGNGTLAATAAGGVTVAGAGTNALTLTGTLADLNTYLASANQPSFTAAANFNGTVTLTMVTSDGGNTGIGGTLTDTDTSTITVSPVNDAPVNTLPSGYTLAEDSGALALTGLSVADIDAGSGAISVTLSVPSGSGTLNATGANGVSVSGAGTSSLVLTGTLANINAFLAGATRPTYSQVANFNGTVTLTMVTSDGGNTGAGGALSDTDTSTITITAVNDAPVNTLPASFTVAEDATLALTGIAISDVDAGGSTMTVTLSVPSGSGALTATGAGGVTVANSGTAAITLTGTLANINAYLASANRPNYTPVANFNGAVTLTMVTSDGGNTGAGGTQSDTSSATITVAPVNDAPVNTLPSGYTLAEDSGALALTGLSVADIDAGSGAISVTLSVPSGSGTLNATGAGGVSVSGAGTSSLVLTGTLANINVFLAGATRPTYSQVADYNGTVTLTMVTSDGGNTGAGGALSDTDTATITITPVADIVADTLTIDEDTSGTAFVLANDTFGPGARITAINGVAVTPTTSITATPPANFNGSYTTTYTVTSGGVTENGTLTVVVRPVNDAPAGTNATLTAVEDTPRAFTQADFGFTDPVEGDGFAGVVITALPANGAMLLNGVAVTAGQFVTAAQIAAGSLTWQAAANANGNGLGSFTFQVRDTGGTANGGVDTDQSPNTITFNVTAVNDAPQGTNATLSAVEDTPYTLTAGSFGFGDPVEGDAFAGVVISTTAASGTLRLNGVAVTAGQFVTAADIAAGLLTWQGAANANGNGLGSFTFQVRDTGGTANGGVNTDQSPNTISFNVAAVNDAPAGTDATLNAVEDTPYTFAAANFGFGDAIDGNAFAGVVVTTLPANGTLLLNGVAVSAGQFVTAAQIAAGQLTWQGAANANGSGLGSFTFQVRDDGGTANGGVDTDQSPNTIRFNVTPVNDAPAGTNATLTAIEDTPYTFAAANFGFGDLDGNAFAGVVITTIPANGTMLLNGVAVTNGTYVTAAQLAAGQLTWQGPANANGANLGSFTFQVRDDGGTASGGIDTDQSPNTISFSVTPVSDAPQGTNAVLGATEDTPRVFAAADFGFGDPIDGDAFAGVVITTAPADGTMLLNGVAVANGTYVTAAQLAAGQLTWQAAANANGAGLGSFTFQVRDTGSTANGGVVTDPTPNTISFTVAAVNDAPVLDLNRTTATYTENGAPVAIAGAAASVTDVDSATMTSATVVLTNPQTGDQLTVNGSTAASGTVNGIPYTRTATGVTLSGSFPNGQYADALKLIGFSNTGDNPNGTVTRDITVTVNDGQANSNTARVAITVTPVNDPIVNAVRDYSVAEDSPLTLSGLSVSDIDANAGTIAVTLSVPAGAGTLTAASAGNVAATGSGGAAITLSGTLADINAYLANAATQPVFRQGVADFNGTVVLTMTSNDNGNTGTGGATTDTDTAVITITPVADIAPDTASVNEDGAVTISPLANDSFENGAPQITAVNGTAIAGGGSVAVANGTVSLGANNQLTFTPAANFNGPASFSYTVTSGGVTETANVAVTVNAVNDRPTLTVPATIAATEDTSVALTGIAFGDVDAATGAVRATLSAASGRLNWTAAAGVAASGSGSGTLVLTGSIGAINGAIAAANLTYTPAANVNGAVVLTTTINDQGNSGIDPGTSGDAASEEASATTTINIAPVNDAPVAANDSFATTENAAVTVNVLANDTDVDSATLTITQVNGVAIATGGSVAVTGGSVRLNAGGTLTYTPNAGYSGSPSFTYTVSDGALASTATVFGQVGAINHAPSGTDATLTVLEDATYTFATADFGYGDALDGNAFTGVVVATLPASGVLSLNGAAVSAGQFVTAADIAGGRLTFVPAANASGTGLAAFTFRVRDDGGTANGGVDTDQSPNTITFNVTPVNDAPSGTDAVLAATEDTPYVLTQGSFGFGDPADGDAFAGTIIATLPASGALTLNGVAVTAGQFVTAADIAAGRLIWTPAANANGNGLGSFTFRVRDTGGTANGGVDTDASANSLSFNVAPVNDAPVAANDSFTVAEDTAATIDVRANDTDVDAGTVLTVTAVNGTGLVAGGAGVAVTGGTVTLDAQGRLVFTPFANFNGATGFTYTVRDEAGATATATVTGTITPVADPVVNVVPATAAGSEDTTLVFGAANGRQIAVSDPDNGTLTVTLTARQGVITLSTTAGLTFTAGDGTADATMTFTGATAAINAALDGLGFIPRADYNGAAQIAVTTTRAQDGASDSDTIAITLAPVADAVDDRITTAEDTPVSFNVLTGAGGASADNFEDAGRSVTAVTQPPAGQGSVTFAANGAVTFTPAADFNGTTSFTYTVTAGGVTETATVTVTVTPVNDAPVVDLDGSAAGTGYLTSFTENGAGVAIIAADGSVADVDSIVLTGARAVVTNGASGDLLSVAGTLPAGITASYDPASYTLTLSGNATAGQYRTALAAVRYLSTSENPAAAARTIAVTVSDGALASAVATATVAIVRVNDAPQGTSAVLSATEDTPYVLGAADFGFGDPAEGDGFAGVVISTLPANGALRVDGAAVTAGQFVTAAQIAAGRLTWQGAANANGNGLGSFTFQVRDTGGTANGGVDTDQSPNTITFNVAAVNDAPVSSDLAVTTTEDGSISGVLPGYTDADGDIATYRAGATPPANGSVTVNANGSYTYTPRADFNGTDVFSFVVDDGRGGTTERTVTVTVTPVNDAPVLVSPVPDRTRPDGAIVSYDVSTFFADPADGDTLTYTAAGLPPGLTISAAGLIGGTLPRDASQGGPGGNGVYTVVVTASDGKGGTVSDTLVFTVTNPAPVATNDTATTAEDTPVTVAVLANDSDPDGDPLTVTGAVAANGTAAIGAGGAITYTPNANFNGTDTIVYTISDGNGGTTQATVTVTVTPVNDAPTATTVPDRARFDGEVITFDAAGYFSDVDGNALTYGATGLPPGLAIDPATGRISGRIAAGASGATGTATYTVTLTASDGAATATTSFRYTISNIAPTANDDTAGVAEDGVVDIPALANDSDVDGDTIAIVRVNNVALGVGGPAVAVANGQVQLVQVGGGRVLRFTPTPDYNGTTSFTYTIDDGNSGTDDAVVTVNVAPGNDAPRSQPIPDRVRADGQIFAYDIGAFFSDPDGDPLNYAVTGLPAGLTIDAATGRISGTIDRAASQGGPTGNGVYSVTVTAFDGPGGSGLSTSRTFQLNTTNPAPTGNNDAATTAEDTPVTVAVLTNDTDPDGDPLTVTSAAAGHGTVAINADGTLTYTPAANYNGSDTIIYTIADGNGGTSSASVVVRVTAVNDAPAVRAIPAIRTSDTAQIDIDAGSYFSDIDGQALTFTRTGTLPPGLTFDPATGRISGTIASNASNGGGGYATTISADDGNGGTVSTTITWVVQNLPPRAVSDTLFVSEDAGATSGVNVLDNDVDPDNDGKLVAAVDGSATNIGRPVTGSAGGVFIVNADGTYTFEPGEAFADLQVGETRTTTITYLLDDTDGGTDTGILTVTVDGRNDAPVAAAIPGYTAADGQSITANPIELASFFSDVESDALTFTATGLPAGLVLGSDGRITGTIANNASVSGPYTVTVTASDGRATTARSFTFTVTDPAPTAVDDVATTTEDTAVDIDVVGNDTDPDGDALVIDPAFAPQAAHGTVTINPDGTLRYVPAGNFNGTDTIVYRLSDGQGGLSSGSVRVTVTPVNDAPTATAIPGSVRNDGDAVSFNVSGYFSDVDRDTLTYVASGLPAGLTLDPATGVISGTIASNASGAGGRTDYAVSVTANDGNGQSVTTTFTLTAVNIAPTARPDSASTAEDTAVTIAVLANDTDPDGDGIAVIRINNVTVAVNQSVAVADGTVTLVADAGTLKLRFTPATDFNGIANFTYTIGDGNGGFSSANVNVAVTAVNDAPVAASPIPDRSRPDGAAVSFNVAAFFADADGDALTFSATGLPPGLTFDAATGTIGGTIDRNASQGGVGGAYSVSITARDPSGATATQAFVFATTNPAPVARRDNVTVAEDGRVTFNPISGAGTTNPGNSSDSDPDGDPLTVVRVNDQPIVPGGSVTLAEGVISMNADGTLTFAPAADFNGGATASYLISDGNGGTAQGIIAFTVTPVNDAPSVDLNGAAAGTGRSLVFTEGGPPLAIAAADASASDPENQLVAIDLALAGFLDPGQEGLRLSGGAELLAGTPASGTVAIGNSVLRYSYNGSNALHFEDAASPTAPIARETATALVRALQYVNRSDAPTAGDRSFIVTATDLQGAVSPAATTTIQVAPVNDAPTSTAIPAQSGADGAAVSLDLSGYFTDPDSTLTFAATNLPAGLTLDPVTGVVAGTIDRSASLSGPYTVTVTAGDGVTTAQRSFVFTVTNPAPVAVGDTLTVGENAGGTGDVKPGTPGQDFDPDGDPLSVSAVNGNAASVGASVAGSNGGRFSIAADGSYRFDPSGDFDDLAAGQTRVTQVGYTVSDGQGGFGTATVTVTVTGANDGPVARPLNDVAAADGQRLSIATAAAFADPDLGDTRSYSATGLPAGLSIDPATGEILGRLSAAASAGSPYAVTVTVTDGGGLSATSSFVLTARNVAPVAQADSATVNEDTTLSGSVAANDADGAPDGDPLSYSLVGAPAHGTLLLNADGRYTYTPEADYAGADSFTYQVSDGQGGTATAVVTISVVPVNDAPVAVGDRFSTTEDTPVTFDVRTNDVDPDGPALAVTAIDGRAIAAGQSVAVIGGRVTLNADGTLTFTPAPDYNGAPSFSYSVSDGTAVSTASVSGIVTPVNDAPTANPPAIVTPEDVPAVGRIGAIDADGDPLSYSLVGRPAHGTLTLGADGSYRYVPDADYNGADSFQVLVSDGNGSSVVATVPISVTPVNDAPIASAPPLSTAEDTPATGRIVARDVEGDPLSYAVVTAPTGGTLLLNADGSYTYTPNADFNGTDSFAIRVADGRGGVTIVTVPVSVAAVNDAPVAPASTLAVVEDVPATGRIAARDVDGDALSYAVAVAPRNGTVRLAADGSYTYTPNADFNGADSFGVLVSDGNGGQVVSTVSVTVAPVNDAPVVTARPLATSEDTPATGRIVASDADGDAVRYATATAPRNGTLLLNADGSYTYTPNADFNGSDSFAISVSDGNGGVTIVTVPVTVAAVNDAPTVQASPLDATGGAPAVGRIVATDVDGDTLTFAVATAPAHGTLTVNADGTYRYVPDPDFVGTDSFRVRVSDANGGTMLVTVPVTVRAGYVGADVGALIAFGDPFAGGFTGAADRARTAALRETVQPRIDASPIVLRTVDGIRRLDGTPTLAGDTPVLRAVDGIRRLDGTEPLTGVDHPIDRVVHYLDRFTVLGSDADRLFDSRFDAFAVRSFEGFSVRAIDGGDHQLVLESVVRGHVMYIELRDEGTGDQSPIVEFQLRARDGRPLPDWIRFDRRGLAIVERPLDADVLRLIAVGIREDGSRIELPVIVQGATGEVQRDAPPADARTSDAGSLKALAGKAHHAGAAETARLLAAFGSTS